MKDQIHNKTANGADALFAAANSGRGFVSFYRDVFCRDTIKKRFIIKGGPGTGKSSFMKEIASHVQERGVNVVNYRCSSDPDSLDGIILDGKIAFLDGTSPHAMDTELPGVRDEIINLGEFWDGERLAERYNDIVALSALKSNSYSKAYRFLSAAMEVEQVNIEMIYPFVNLEKMRGAVKRQLKGIADGKRASVSTGLASSIGMKGSVRFDTYERQAERLYVIDDHYSTASLFLSLIIEEAKKKECAIRVSYRPLLPSLPDAVLFEESGVCFVSFADGTEESCGRINMKRFVDSASLGKIKTEYRINKRISDALMESACSALEDAGRYHFELENIYVSCMDFDSEQKFTVSFCQKIDRLLDRL